MAEKTYLVWDKLNGTEDGAIELEAYDAESAAVGYAEADSDGHTDGLYLSCPQPIMVKHPDGRIEEFSVRGSVSVDYFAHSVTT